MRVYRAPQSMGAGRVARERHRCGSAPAERTHAHDAASLADAGSPGNGGMSWAHQAREPGAPILSRRVGFSSGFQAAARVSGHPVTLWTLKDLYATVCAEAMRTRHTA